MDSRAEVAREAARLLYIGDAKEYKQAKEKAISNLGISAQPSNYEVALELDIISDQMEGETRPKLLVKMRQHALKLMRALEKYYPILKGSVWRGTSRKSSDIDINVYSIQPEDVVYKLKKEGYSVEDSKEEVAVHGDLTSRSTHIFVYLNGIKAEIIVRPPEERGDLQRCEIYRDINKGLTLVKVEKLMKTDPLRKFVPRRRYK